MSADTCTDAVWPTITPAIGSARVTAPECERADFDLPDRITNRERQEKRELGMVTQGFDDPGHISLRCGWFRFYHRLPWAPVLAVESF